MAKRRTNSAAEFRILIIGDRAVGKSSFIGRYIRNEFPVRSNFEQITYSTVIDGNDCTLIFIEISSVSQLSRLKLSDHIPTACLLIFSITDQRSFSKLNYFQDMIRMTFTELSRTMPLILVANKIDLEFERTVNEQSIDRIKAHGFSVFDTSCKGNVGIGDAIYTAIKQLEDEQCDRLQPAKPCQCLLS